MIITIDDTAGGSSSTAMMATAAIVGTPRRGVRVRFGRY